MIKNFIVISGINLNIGDVIKISSKYDMNRYEVVEIRQDELNRDIYTLEEMEYL